METSYYPQRARWYSPLLSFWDKACHRLALNRLHVGASVPFLALVACFLVPGLAFVFRWPIKWGIRLFAGCLGLAAVGVVWLGYPVANLAFGLLLSAHVTGFTMLFEKDLADRGILTRIRFSLCAMIAITLGMYLPLRHVVEQYWLLPLRIQDRVLVINRLASSKTVHRGDWIAYQIERGQATGVILESGYGLGPVLARDGDTLTFTPDALKVNEAARPRRPAMPNTGARTVPTETWFIWPEVESHQRGYPNRPNIEAMLLEAAFIHPEQFVGKPFTRWFFRRQVPRSQTKD